MLGTTGAKLTGNLVKPFSNVNYMIIGQSWDVDDTYPIVLNIRPSTTSQFYYVHGILSQTWEEWFYWYACGY